MKSIVEEASSIFKAIENAWIRAEKPDNFSIKIFEDAQRNFFGLTTKSAKIGFLFQEKPEKQHATQAATPRKQKHKEAYRPQRKPHEQEKKKPNAQTQPVQKKLPVEPKEAASQSTTFSAWSPEMIDAANLWVTKSLAAIGLSNIKFTAAASKYHLRFQFESKILADRMREKALFSSFAYLIMASLRNKFKKELRGLKVVLSSS
jgi:hypothetical protein